MAGYDSDIFRRHLRRSEGCCPGCPTDCVKEFSAPEPDLDSSRRRVPPGGGRGPWAESWDRDLRTIITANTLCHLLGLDVTSLGFSLSFVMECSAVGFLSPATLDGLDVRFGNDEVIPELIERIAYRRGVGDMLAEGVKRMAACLAPETEAWALHVKGLEMTCFDPRCMTNLALAYTTAAVGPQFDLQEHDWDFDDTDPVWPHSDG